MVTLRFFKGLMLSDSYAPGLKWSEELKAYAGLAYLYREVKEYFEESGVEVSDQVLDTLPLPPLRDSVRLRDYQREALDAWLKSGKRGVIVLPTGAGKTSVALKAIAVLSVPTLIVVPTIDLMSQWASAIREKLGVEPGMVGGGRDEKKGITVTTYDSAYSRAEEMGNRFALLVFDEVHHLPSEGYSMMAKLFAAPYRMGLTATPERDDGRHAIYPEIVGPIVYRKGVKDLAGKYVADFEVRKVYVSLLPEERERYEELRKKLKGFLEKRKLSMKSLEDFERLVKLAAKDREAREALLAWHESVRLAVNSRAKVEKLRELLEEFRGEKVLVFTRDTQLAYEISREFLVPVITYKTDKDEREEILRKFRDGVYRVLVASTVLDEGVDVPDASVAVVLGGYGTRRQFVQRLGRVLRGKEGKKAVFIEIVTKGTVDYRLSKKRGRIEEP